MPSFESEIEFDVICACGSDLKAVANNKRGYVVEVEPCTDCMDKAFEDGQNDQ